MIDFSPSATKTYEDERYERLSETLDEYFGGTGAEMGLEAFIRDVKKACLDFAAHHRPILDDLTTLSDMLP
jgi:hypothetical protein